MTADDEALKKAENAAGDGDTKKAAKQYFEHEFAKIKQEQALAKHAEQKFCNKLSRWFRGTKCNSFSNGLCISNKAGHCEVNSHPQAVDRFCRNRKTKQQCQDYTKNAPSVYINIKEICKWDGNTCQSSSSGTQPAPDAEDGDGL